MSLKNVIIASPVLLLLFAVGCGANSFEFLADKDSKAAKREAAQLAIDQGDYSEAIAILEAACPGGVCSNTEDAQQLASAYMGEAGLDLLDFLDAADKLSGDSGDGSDFETISTLFPDITADNLDSMNNAIALLENIPAEDRSDDVTLQLGMAQVTGAIIAIGVAGDDPGYDEDTGTPNFCGDDGDCDGTEVTDNLTPEELADIATNITDGVANINQTSLVDSDTDTVTQSNDLIYNIQNSTVGTCSSSNNVGTLDDTTVTGSQIETYIIACL